MPCRVGYNGRHIAFSRPLQSPVRRQDSSPPYPIVRGEDFVRTVTRTNFVIRIGRVTRGPSVSVIFLETGFLPLPSPCKTRCTVVTLGARVDSTSYPPVKNLLPRRPSRFPPFDRAMGSGCFRFVNIFTPGRLWDTGAWHPVDNRGRRERQPIVPGTVLPASGVGGCYAEGIFLCSNCREIPPKSRFTSDMRKTPRYIAWLTSCS
jgi:hypothetical protein